MISLEDLINNENNRWLELTYEDVYESGISEEEFYMSKYELSGDFSYRSYPHYRLLINERLKESLDAEWLRQVILNNIKHIVGCEPDRQSGKLLTIEYDDSFRTSKDDQARFSSIINFFNYYMSKDIPELNLIQLEPRKLEVDSKYAYPYVYHITTKQRYEKIKKVGLHAKSHSRKSYHPDRIYVLSHETTYNQLIECASMLYKDIHECVILKIDTERMEKEWHWVNFYRDPQFRTDIISMQTMESIPTKFIKLYKEL